jgi:hypothetical protein
MLTFAMVALSVLAWIVFMCVMFWPQIVAKAGVTDWKTVRRVDTNGRTIVQNVTCPRCGGHHCDNFCGSASKPGGIFFCTDCEWCEVDGKIADMPSTREGLADAMKNAKPIGPWGGRTDGSV